MLFLLIFFLGGELHLPGFPDLYFQLYSLRVVCLLVSGASIHEKHPKPILVSHAKIFCQETTVLSV